MNLKFYYDKDLPKPTKLKEKYLKEQVEYLKTLPHNEQKSPEWYAMRLTMVSASDWGTILGENHYSNPNQVLLKKCGEDNFMTNAAMQWGNKYEDVAISIYEYRNNTNVFEFGCLRHPYVSCLGASPDGITADGVMLEIKCPTSRQITGIPPRYYWCQVQGQLEVCELDRCDFLECKLKEYEDEDEYLNDHFENNHLMNKHGHEKGVVAEFLDKTTRSFFYKYSPVCIVGDNLDVWKEAIVRKNTSENVIFSSFDYWFLEEISCVPIYRNQEWFNDAKIILQEFWEKVLKYRALGLDTLKYDLEAEKIAKKEERIQKKEEKERLEKERLEEKLEEKKQKKEEKDKEKEAEKETKKQRKMKDYIIFDDIKDNTSDNITEKKPKIEVEIDNLDEDNNNQSFFTITSTTIENIDDDRMSMSDKNDDNSEENTNLCHFTIE